MPSSVTPVFLLVAGSISACVEGYFSSFPQDGTSMKVLEGPTLRRMVRMEVPDLLCCNIPFKESAINVMNKCYMAINGTGSFLMYTPDPEPFHCAFVEESDEKGSVNGDNVGNGSGNDVDSWSGDHAGNGSSDDVGSGNGDVAGNGSGDVAGNGIGDDVGSGSGDVAGSGSGDDFGSGSGDDFPRRSGDDVFSGSGDDLGSGSGDVAGNGSGDDVGSGSGDDAFSGSGDDVSSGSEADDNFLCFDVYSYDCGNCHPCPKPALYCGHACTLQEHGVLDERGFPKKGEMIRFLEDAVDGDNKLRKIMKKANNKCHKQMQKTLRKGRGREVDRCRLSYIFFSCILHKVIKKCPRSYRSETQNGVDCDPWI